MSHVPELPQIRRRPLLVTAVAVVLLAAAGWPRWVGSAPADRGKALLVTGTIPLVGTDVQFKAALEAAGLDVEVIQDKAATPMHARGKRLILLSYGMTSTAFDAEAFVDVAVPIILTEHNLLPRLRMSPMHGYTDKGTTLAFVSDHALAGGQKGDVEVYSTSQEFFAYEKGATMVGAIAPAKRVQFFHASHSPDPIDPNRYLNATGLKLLDATIAWCLE